MADPITGAATVSSLLQQIQASYAGLKTSTADTQALTNQLQKTAVPVKAPAITLTSQTVGPNSNLPRGSLVDITA